MVLDRPLLARGDDDDLLDAGGDGLLDRVLDDRLVDQRAASPWAAPWSPGGSGCPSRRQGRRPCGRASNLGRCGLGGRRSIPPGPGRTGQAVSERSRANRRTRDALKAAGWSRFERCSGAGQPDASGIAGRRGEQRLRTGGRAGPSAPLRIEGRAGIGGQPRARTAGRTGRAGRRRRRRTRTRRRRSARRSRPGSGCGRTSALSRSSAGPSKRLEGDGQGPVGQRPDADRLGRRAGEDQAAHPLRIGRRELHRHVAAERQADHDRAAAGRCSRDRRGRRPRRRRPG